MPFDPRPGPSKVGIEDIEVVTFSPGPNNNDNPQAGAVNAQYTMSDGSVEVESFDLLARLQDDAEGLVHLANLASLRDYIRVRLNSETL